MIKKELLKCSKRVEYSEQLEELNTVEIIEEFLNRAINLKRVVFKIDRLDSGADLVLYDVSDCPGEVLNGKDFNHYINQAGLDEEAYEMDRCTLIKSSY